jgi:hypothetical protein
MTTIPAAAARAGVHPNAIRSAINRGVIRSKRVRGRRLVYEASLNAYMKDRQAAQERLQAASRRLLALVMAEMRQGRSQAAFLARGA